MGQEVGKTAGMRGDTEVALKHKSNREAKMKTNEMKTAVKTWLAQKGLDHKVTARTIDFTDLARASKVFVKVHGWKPDQSWLELETLAKKNGFCVEA